MFVHYWNGYSRDPKKRSPPASVLEQTAGLKEVAKLQQLTVLGLQGTKITDVGLYKVAKLTQLEKLLLNHTKVTIAGVTQISSKLQTALPKCKIFSNAKK